MQLVLVGLNYKTASLNEREQFSLDIQEKEELLKCLHASQHIHEVVVLSTCNRMEVYALAMQVESARDKIIRQICALKGCSAQVLESLTYTFYNKFAAQHIYKVASGVDSMVFGENEILKQVKDALTLAQSFNVSGAILNKLFQSVIEAGKRVRTETGINRGAASLGSVAAQKVQAHLQHLPEARVLLLGVGQIGEVTLKNLQTESYSLYIANRTQEKAIHLSEKMHNVEACIGLEAVPSLLKHVHAVICCTGAPDYLITAQDLEACNIETELLMVDLSVPRNLDPALSQNEHVVLYDVDHLKQEIEMSQSERRQWMDVVESILGDEMSRFLEWFNTLDVVPTIQSLYQLFNDIRQSEIERGLKKYQGECSEDVKDLLERVTRGITQKILHYPVVQLRMEPDLLKKQDYTDTLSDLFKLETEDYIDRYLYRSKEPVHKPQNIKLG